MPSHFEYAAFSTNVYENTNQYIPAGWQVLASTTDPKNEYQGRAYVNHTTREVVIAHRGTIPGTEIVWQDIPILFGDRPPQYDQSAIPFNLQIHRQMKNSGMENYHLSFTGHSLGATLAELSIVDNASFGVTFESPGSKPMMDVSQQNYAQQHIISYNAFPNQINSTNLHVCQLIRRVYPAFAYSVAAEAIPPNPALFFNYVTKQQHHILPIYQQFNPKTGLPKAYSEHRPQDWPAGSEAAYTAWVNYSKSCSYWDTAITIMYSAHGGGFSIEQFKTNYIRGMLSISPDALSQPGTTIYLDKSGGVFSGGSRYIEDYQIQGGSWDITAYNGNNRYWLSNGSTVTITEMDRYENKVDSRTNAFVERTYVASEIYIDGNSVRGVAHHPLGASTNTYTLKTTSGQAYRLVKLKAPRAEVSSKPLALASASSSSTAMTPTQSTSSLDLLQKHNLQITNSESNTSIRLNNFVGGFFKITLYNPVHMNFRFFAGGDCASILAGSNAETFVSLSSIPVLANGTNDEEVTSQAFNSYGRAISNATVISKHFGSPMDDHVSTYPTGAPLANGNVVAAWLYSEIYVSDYDTVPYCFRILSPLGQPVSGVIMVEGSNVGDDNNIHYASPAVMGLPNGNFMIVYRGDYGQDPGDGALFLRVYTEFGSPVSSPILLDAAFEAGGSIHSSSFGASICVLENNKVVIAWTMYPSNTYAAIKVATVSLGGTIERIFYMAYGDAEMPSVAALKDNKFAITWTSARSYPYSAIAAIATSDGQLASLPFRLGMASEDAIPRTGVASLGNGNFVLSWGSNFAAYAQVFSSEVHGGVPKPHYPLFFLTGGLRDWGTCVTSIKNFGFAAATSYFTPSSYTGEVATIALNTVEIDGLPPSTEPLAKPLPQQITQQANTLTNKADTKTAVESSASFWQSVSNSLAGAVTTLASYGCFFCCPTSSDEDTSASPDSSAATTTASPPKTRTIEFV